MYHVNNTIHVPMNVFYKLIEVVDNRNIFNQTELSITFTKYISFCNNLYMHIYTCVCVCVCVRVRVRGACVHACTHCPQHCEIYIIIDNFSETMDIRSFTELLKLHLI